MKRKVRITVATGEAGQSVLGLLGTRFSYLGRAQWRRHIRQKRLLLNCCPTVAHARLRAGDLLEFHPPSLPEPAVRRNYRVLYEDEQILAIDKPPNLPCHPGGRYFRHTLWAFLKDHTHLGRPIFVHRIDRETSGIVMVAKTPAAAAALRRQFEDGTVEKSYLCVVEGKFPLETVEARGYLFPDVNSPVRKKQRFSTDLPVGRFAGSARWCHTTFCGRAVHGGLSLVAARPHTGRCHQIRASLHGLGFPIAGDKLYGLDERFFLRFIQNTLTTGDRCRLRIGRQALHAAEIRCLRPRDNRMLHLTSALPSDLSDLFQAADASLLQALDTFYPSLSA